jgi:hypothetical protein
MTEKKIHSCVTQGLCTWEQVRETLSNAGASDAEINAFIDGKSPLGRAQREMLYRLLETGKVPVQPVISYATLATSSPPAHAVVDVELPELLYCLGVLRPLPAEAPSSMSDAMFGVYRRIRYDESWVRERFGECDAHYGPHRFFAFSVFADDRPIATVWAREDEGDHDVLELKLKTMFHVDGVLALRREIFVHH